MKNNRKITPDKEAAYSSYLEAHKYLRLEYFNNANSSIDKSIKLRPKNALYWYTKALIQDDSGDKESAIDSALMAVHLKKKWDMPYRLLGYIYYDRCDYINAIKYYGIAININQDVSIFTILANIHLQNSPAESLRYADLALDLEPDWEEAINIRNEALFNINNNV